jgi:hypothetical protein
MLVAADLLACAVYALMSSEGLLSNAAADAGLGSALTSFTKRAVQFMRAAASMPEQPTAENAAGRYFLAAAPVLVNKLFIVPVQQATGEAAAAGSSSSNSSSSSIQAAPSSALLAVVFARSLVQLADAMEAAGPHMLYESLVGKPAFCVCWAAELKVGFLVSRLGIPAISADNPHSMSAEVQWQQKWQAHVVVAAEEVMNSITRLNLTPAAAAPADADTGDAARTPTAAAPAAAAAAGGGVGSSIVGDASSAEAGSSQTDMHASAAGSSSSSSSSSSNSSSQLVQRRYLLHLLQTDAAWTAAVAEYQTQLHFKFQKVAGEQSSLNDVIYGPEMLTKQYAASVDVCRALAAAAPLPVVCNNPSCENPAGVSEAAAASKLCSGCRCRYCCAACHTADWRRHKRACRCMAAAGLSCV